MCLFRQSLLQALFWYVFHSLSFFIPREFITNHPATRVWESITSDASQQMDDYTANLKSLQSALEISTTIEATVIIHRVFNEVQAQGKIIEEHSAYLCC